MNVTCRECGQPLRDRISKLFRIGPDCDAAYLAARGVPA